MSGEEDYVMRPVIRGLCKYESLVDGTLNLVDVAVMNEALDVSDTNAARLHDYFAKQK